MSNFLQLHLLTSYPPACLNRDDLNRPKSAIMGGINRLRISSQSLKRAWRVSDVFREQLTGETGIRSKELGRKIRDALLSGLPLTELLMNQHKNTESDQTIQEKDANEWAWRIAAEFVDKKNKSGDDENDADESEEADESDKKSKKPKPKKAKSSNVSKETLKSEQIVFYSRAELDYLDALVKELRETKTKPPTDDQFSRIKVKGASRTADLALFGRMLASSPHYNTEAACQVAHAITVHRAAVEDDFFTAVDDLNHHEEDAGSAHMGEQGFGAGLFYQYVCIDCDRLLENLSGDTDLASRTIQALIEAAATVAPTGKQNSFASRACAYYVLAEKGSRQPRSLSLAFMKPVSEGDMLDGAVAALTTMRDNLDKVYYQSKPLASRSIDAISGEGDFSALKTWAATAGDGA